jgi:outer membrane immunogenic protein
MMRTLIRCFLATTSSLALASAASAADLLTKAPPLTPAPVASWVGPYIGLNLGSAWNHAEFSDIGSSCCKFAFTGPQPFWTTDNAGITLGGQAGYNLQTGSVVYGLETDLNWVDASTSASLVPTFGTTIAASTKLEWMGSVRGRLGIAFGPALVYATGGLAYAHFSDAWGHASNGGNAFSNGETRLAGIFGGGVEYMVARNWTARVEALYANFGTSSIGVVNPDGAGGGPYVSSFEHRVATARAALSFKW